jgi:hypothetical protein
MPYIVCPECKNRLHVTPSDFQDTIQCEKCTKMLRVLIRNSITNSVHLQKIDLDIPRGLPENLEKILTEAITSCEAGNYASAVVMSGLFLEGLLKEAGFEKNSLSEMIKVAHEEKALSSLGYHVATASRLFRNMGAHYSPELSKLDYSDARLILEMVRKLAVDILSSGLLSSAKSTST